MGGDKVLKERLPKDEYDKLAAIENRKVHEFIARYVEMCNPDSVFVLTDDEKDMGYVRRKAIDNKEEIVLGTEGHTVHFDGYLDQARDKKNTKLLLADPKSLGANINAIERNEGLFEIHTILRDIMKGHELFVRFSCLGPLNSEFSIPCVQLTDSAYVVHSEDLLYRRGYELFKSIGEA